MSQTFTTRSVNQIATELTVDQGQRFLGFDSAGIFTLNDFSSIREALFEVPSYSGDVNLATEGIYFIDETTMENTVGVDQAGLLLAISGSTADVQTIFVDGHIFIRSSNSGGAGWRRWYQFSGTEVLALGGANGRHIGNLITSSFVQLDSLTQGMYITTADGTAPFDVNELIIVVVYEGSYTDATNTEQQLTVQQAIRSDNSVLVRRRPLAAGAFGSWNEISGTGTGTAFTVNTLNTVGFNNDPTTLDGGYYIANDLVGFPDTATPPLLLQVLTSQNNAQPYIEQVATDFFGTIYRRAINNAIPTDWVLTNPIKNKDFFSFIIDRPLETDTDPKTTEVDIASLIYDLPGIGNTDRFTIIVTGELRFEYLIQGAYRFTLNINYRDVDTVITTQVIQRMFLETTGLTVPIAFDFQSGYRLEDADPLLGSRIDNIQLTIVVEELDPSDSTRLLVPSSLDITSNMTVEIIRRN